MNEYPIRNINNVHLTLIKYRESQIIFYGILDLPDSKLHLELQQDQQVCGRFGIFSVAHLKFQTHHNVDKRRNPCCDEKIRYFSCH